MANRTFEQAMQELETLVLKIENENLGLEDAVEYYQKSKELASYCENLINDAKQKITFLEPSDC